MAESASPGPAATCTFEVPEDVVSRLKELCDIAAAPLSTAVASAMAALLHRYCCEGTLAIRTTNANETRVGLLPVSAVVPDDSSFEQMLARGRDVLPNLPEDPEIEILVPHEFNPQSPPIKVGFRTASKRLIGALDVSQPSMADHLRSLLCGLANHPSVPLSTIRMLGYQELRKILMEWNQTDRGYPQGSVPELVEQRVQRTPHAVALIQGDNRLTYHELNVRANRLANYLRDRGVGSETLVGLCMEQSLNAVVAILAILKAGGAYVPLDPSLPQDRLEEISADAELAIAITSARFRHRVPPGIDTVCVDRDSERIAAESPATPFARITPDNAAYVLYTSASTGKAKGVVGVHRGIMNGLMSVNYAPDEVCCLNTFLSYAFSLANLFLPLMSGVPVVVLSDEQIRDSNQMMTVLEREGVTRLVMVPAVLQQILNPDFGASSRLRKITTVGVAGSKLTSADAKRLAKAMPQARIYNRYASTEIGTVAAVWEVDAESLAGGEIPIGRPAANTRIYILDPYMNPLPAGVVGEIWVSAAHLARGYLNRPDLTEQRFVSDPFSIGEGRRLYRTGDLGRFRPGGEIEFAGRTDHQVKINGFRVDLPEVERMLTSHPGVSEAAVAVQEIGNRQRLVAYVVAKPVGTPNSSQLRKFLQDRLPNYAIPARFIFLAELDRNALPPVEPVRPRLENNYQPARTAMEVAIAQIWSDLLGLDPIGIHDPFRDLGGDSISAASVALRLGQRFGIDITPEELLDRPTIAELAVHLSSPRATYTGLPGSH